MPTKQTKKTAIKSVEKKATVKTAPVMEHHCGCGEHCNCHCHGSAHWIKHIIVWAIIFVLGMACGKIMDCGGHGPKHMMKKHPVFTDGCLDMKSIDCPKMQEEIVKADVNADGCISIEEYKAFKKEHRMGRKGKGMRGHRKAK